MYILGLGGSNHDFSSCLLKDNKVLCMIDDERITRKKYGVGLGVELLKGFSKNYCLNYSNITIDDVDLIVGNDILSKLMFHRLGNRITLINHHLSHAASVFYPSNMNQSSILIIDGVGSKKEINGELQYESITYAYGEGTNIEILDKQFGRNIKGTDNIENSLGIFYSLVTEIAGFGEHEEGKTMGLAPYGTKKYYLELKKYIRYLGNGKIHMNEEDIKGLLNLKELITKENDQEKKFQIKADIAWAGQQILEEIMIELANYLYQITKCKNLCIAGGVGLNSVANYKIYKKCSFTDLFIQPAAADNGTSLGAALYGYYVISGKPRYIEN